MKEVRGECTGRSCAVALGFMGGGGVELVVGGQLGGGWKTEGFKTAKKLTLTPLNCVHSSFNELYT